MGTDIENYSSEMSDDFILKNPINYGARITGVKNKIYNATGIPPHKLDIIRVSISDKKVKLAWISFTKTGTVSEIFRLSVHNGNMTRFNAFPHVPSKAMAPKEGIEVILKRLQGINKQLRYQVRLGTNDLDIMLKVHKEHDYKPYRRIELKNLDPNEEVPAWDLDSKKPPPVINSVNPFDISKQAGKRGAIESLNAGNSK